MTRGVRTMIDLERARELRRLHWTWPAIGKQLAIERGRRVPYQGRSVEFALRKAAEPSARKEHLS